LPRNYRRRLFRNQLRFRTTAAFNYIIFYNSAPIIAISAWTLGFFVVIVGARCYDLLVLLQVLLNLLDAGARSSADLRQSELCVVILAGRSLIWFFRAFPTLYSYSVSKTLTMLLIFIKTGSPTLLLISYIFHWRIHQSLFHASLIFQNRFIKLIIFYLYFWIINHVLNINLISFLILSLLGWHFIKFTFWMVFNNIRHNRSTKWRILTIYTSSFVTADVAF